ncbi:MAG: hypothetical protein AAGF60_16390 [Pseudomonadota bacterium]
MDATHIERIRQIALGTTALACLGYALMSLIQDRPDPFYWWVPGTIGTLAALAISLVERRAGPRETDRATDEMYLATQRGAAATAFWVGMALVLLAAVASVLELFDPRAMLTALGTGMAGTYLGLLVWRDVSGG